MYALSLLLVLAGADPVEGLSEKMLPVYAAEAAEYTVALAAAPKAVLELKKDPVLEWSNPVRQGLQHGACYLWLHNGRPAALGCVFSQPHDKPAGRQVIHEFHALDPEKLLITRPSALNEWKPKAGLARTELTDAPPPGLTPAARLVQMRRLAQEFAGHSVDSDGGQQDLRLLPSPLYRYPAAKAGVIDGALFTLVSTAGTDPEVLLVIEARAEGGKAHWEYACGRFSDRSLYVQRRDRQVWSMVRDESNPFNHDPQHLYTIYADKVVSLDGKLLARVKVTPQAWYGEVHPVTDK